MECREFIVEPLPYHYDGLEPYISEEILRIHHDVLYRNYVNNLNKALNNYPEYCNQTLECLILNVEDLPQDIAMSVFNNAGGTYNHQLYFETMNPTPNEGPKGELLDAINRKYTNFHIFKQKFKKEAMDVFGSGYTWLAVDNMGKLEIVSTGDQTTALTLNKFPLIGIDVWEHAYFCQYINDRGAYIDSWFELADWNKAGERFR